MEETTNNEIVFEHIRERKDAAEQGHSGAIKEMEDFRVKSN